MIAIEHSRNRYWMERKQVNPIYFPLRLQMSSISTHVRLVQEVCPSLLKVHQRLKWTLKTGKTDPVVSHTTSQNLVGG